LPDDKLWRGWEQPDTDFLKVGFCEGGSDLGIKSHETFPLLGSGNATIEQCEALMRHYNPSVRKSAAHALAAKTSDTPAEGVPETIDPKALDALERGLQHPDERVQRAVCEGLTSYHNWFSFRGKSLVDSETISTRFAPYIVKILKDPKSDIWAKDGALWVMAKARGETIIENLELIESFDDHEIWWLRHSARWRVNGLAASEMVSFKTLEQILDAKQTEGRAFATVDLTKLLQMCVASDKNFTPEQRTEILDQFIALRKMDRDGTGTTTALKDAYGYANQTSGSGMSVGHFYIFLNRLSPQAHIRTYPVLAQYLDDVSTLESKQGWGPFLFYGVKRFSGVMGKLMGAGDAARPIMMRLKRFLTTDDKAVVRIKCEASKRGGGRKIFDPIVERLSGSVAAWERKHGKLDVPKYTRAGKTYTPYVPPPEKVDASADSEAPVKPQKKRGVSVVLKKVVLTGEYLKERVTRKDRRGKVVTVDVCSIIADGKMTAIPWQLLETLPVAFQDLNGAQVEIKAERSTTTDRKRKTTTKIVKIKSLKVISDKRAARVPSKETDNRF
jgi:hypothetical protein